MDAELVGKFFKTERPEFVICAAAKVGGILANNNFPVDFLHNNLLIQNNIFHSAHRYKVKKLLFLGSACVYPKFALQPIKEDSLMTGPLEPTNEPYALAKIAGIKLCEGYNRQFGDNFFSIMPNNLYGHNDNFNPKTSHVIPALIQKFHYAKINSLKSVEIWGSGNPIREFLHVQDLSEAVLFVMKNLNAEKVYSMGITHINIGSGEEITIKDIATLIKKITGFKGEIHFNLSKPDGMPRKLLDSSIIHKLGWASKIPLKTGLYDLYEWYRKQNSC